MADGNAIVLYSRNLIFISTLALAQIFSILQKTTAALPILNIILFSVQPSFAIALPNYTKPLTSSTICPLTVNGLQSCLYSLIFSFLVA